VPLDSSIFMHLCIFSNVDYPFLNSFFHFSLYILLYAKVTQCF
jgi:hypothetical protein